MPDAAAKVVAVCDAIVRRCALCPQQPGNGGPHVFIERPLRPEGPPQPVAD